MVNIDAKGSGFVHLNTPASITYTAGQVLTVSEVKRKKQRIECVTLPCVVCAWRHAMQQYTDEEGFVAFPGDAENERAGCGVMHPPLMPMRPLPASSAVSLVGSGDDANSPHGMTAASRLCADGLFTPLCKVLYHVHGPNNAVAGRRTAAATPLPSSFSSALEAAVCVSNSGGGEKTCPTVTTSGDASSSCVEATEQQLPKAASLLHGISTGSRTDTAKKTKGDAESGSQGGIAIVSHHKVAGVKQFVYPDYDGVLSHGFIPQVVESAEEQSEAAAVRPFYISAAQMTEEERRALEELQMLWRSRARSHSVQGASHRAAVGGGECVLLESGKSSSLQHGESATRRVCGGQGGTDHDEGEGEETVVSADSLLEEALRMADDLLRFA